MGNKYIICPICKDFKSELLAYIHVPDKKYGGELHVNICEECCGFLLGYKQNPNRKE